MLKAYELYSKDNSNLKGGYIKLVTDIKIDKPIVLIGMMGCGKSHIGRILAKDLGLDFFDIDRLIEKDQEKSISDIFASNGESFFRMLEIYKLKSVIDRGVSIVSAGGGIVTTPENMDIIKSKSISIWIKSSVDTILKRLDGDNSRPLLKNDNPKKILQHLLNSREALYSTADIYINNDNDGNIEKVIDKIKQELSKYNEAI